ncbi:hypothetical protein Tco_0801280 [Tanacetum coccineum]|uniref:Gag-Pol polyprotein n=1 Tax=Tanacetum coccineum TaxID=301880 RepID=A0ABQ4ZYY6_9ASTR
MSNTNNNLQTQTSNAIHNAIIEAGGKYRPPMLAPDILPGIDNDIYSIVDACPNTCEMWKAIKSLKQCESINVQDLETNLYWEFRKFTSRDGETLESYYSRFYKMMNELVRNQCDVTNHQVNVQFLLQLQSEWQRPQQAATRNRGKAIINSPPPTYDKEPEMVAKDDALSKEKEIDKLMTSNNNDDDVHDLKSVETEFLAIVFNDTLTPEVALSCEPTVSSLNNNEIDFRISFNESDDDDYMVIFEKNSFSYKIIFVDDLKSNSENDIDKVNMHSFPSPDPTVSYFDDLDSFKDFEKEFPAIVYNDALTSKLDFLTEPTEKLVSKNGYDVLDMALLPRDQRHQYLRFEGLEYTDADITDFEERLDKIYYRGIHRVLVWILSAYQERWLRD